MSRKPYLRESEEQRRAQLAKATLDCVASHGAQGVTVRRIAAAAGVTQGLIRHYFVSKDELVHYAYRLHMRQMAESAAAAGVANRASGIARLAALVQANLLAPVASPRSVAIWASFVALVHADKAIAAIHRQEYVAFRDMIEDALAAALKQSGRRAAKSERTAMAVALNALIDGLWLEAGLAPDMFRAGELAAIGLDHAGRITGMDLVSALEAAA